ncbi:MAG TPA: hypothetical protein VME46_07100 [Acidimicrobiales bacterium]|nr:hypothetical protein [Acidimicrobiales bacterium]
MANQGPVIDPEKLGFHRTTSVDVDDRGRVVLGKALKGMLHKPHRFAAFVNQVGQIVLDPLAEIPARERWIFENPEALVALREGVESARKGPLVDLGSFAKYDTDEDD